MVPTCSNIDLAASCRLASLWLIMIIFEIWIRFEDNLLCDYWHMRDRFYYCQQPAIVRVGVKELGSFKTNDIEIFEDMFTWCSIHPREGWWGAWWRLSRAQDRSPWHGASQIPFLVFVVFDTWFWQNMFWRSAMPLLLRGWILTANQIALQVDILQVDIGSVRTSIRTNIICLSSKWKYGVVAIYCYSRWRVTLL